MNDEVKIYERDIYEILEDYYPKISYVKIGEINQKIRSAAIQTDPEILKIRLSDVSEILYGYYPKISHKLAGRIIRDLEIIQIGEN